MTPTSITRRCRWRRARTSRRARSSRSRSASRPRKTRRSRCGSTMVKWQAGIEYFNQAYDQDAVNTFSAFVLNPQVGVSGRDALAGSVDRQQRRRPVRARARSPSTTRPTSPPGLRFDHESSDAHLNTFFSPAIAPANVVAADQIVQRRVAAVCVRLSRQPAAHRLRSRRRAATRRAASIRRRCPGSEAYGEEHAWHVEGGVKSTLAGGKVAANAAVFFIDWDDLQLNVPNPFVPGQFYIANVGGARSSGVEFDVTARPQPIARRVRGARLHERAVRRRHDGERRRRRRTTTCPTRRTTPRLFGGQMTRADHVDDQRLRARGSGADRRVRVRRRQHAKARTPIRSSTSAPARARKRLFARSVAAQRVRHALRADRDSVSGVCAVGLHRREWPAAHVRRQHRHNVLDQGSGSRIRHQGSLMTTQTLESASGRIESRALVPGPAAITAIADRARGVVPQCRDQLAAGGAVPRRRLRRRGALSRRVRLHLGVARVHCGSARRGPARADADAGDHLRGVFPAAGGRHVLRPAAARIGLADRRRRRRRRVHLRPRHAARRRLRVGHALQRRRRQHAHARSRCSSSSSAR